jgi:hypothetical protein
MRWKPLPFIEEISKLQPEDRAKAQQGALREIANTQGFQLIVAVLQSLDSEALEALRSGNMPSEMYRGYIEALGNFREQLFIGLSAADLGDAANHDLRDDSPGYEYFSPFLE